MAAVTPTGHYTGVVQMKGSYRKPLSLLSSHVEELFIRNM
jgi:hypothetical protein